MEMRIAQFLAARGVHPTRDQMPCSSAGMEPKRGRNGQNTVIYPLVSVFTS
jgi:hypothetical protein